MSAVISPGVLPTHKLVAGCTLLRAVGYRFSCCFMQRNPFIKALNQSCQIVVRGLHINLRSPLLRLEQSSTRLPNDAFQISGHFDPTPQQGR